MKLELLLCSLVIAVFSGCMTTHELWGESAAAVSAGLSKFQGKEVDLLLTNGTLHQDVMFSFFGDSIAFQTEKRSAPIRVPLGSVASVSRSGSALGPILGGLGGMAIGGALGSSMALQDHNSSTGKSTADQIGGALTAPFAAAAGGMAGGLIGGGVGLIIGSFLGSGDRYVLDPGPNSESHGESRERCIAIGVTASGDSIFLGLAAIVDRTPGKVVVLWHGTRIGLLRPPASVVMRGRDVQVIAPETLWRSAVPD